jgi:hypothetical protein
MSTLARRHQIKPALIDGRFLPAVSTLHNRAVISNRPRRGSSDRRRDMADTVRLLTPRRFAQLDRDLSLFDDRNLTPPVTNHRKHACRHLIDLPYLSVPGIATRHTKSRHLTKANSSLHPSHALEGSSLRTRTTNSMRVDQSQAENDHAVLEASFKDTASST